MFDFSSERSQKGRVLVVDDEEGIRKSIQLILKEDGYDVVEAENGKVAIAKLRMDDNPLRVDTILCDIRMPGMDGQEAIEFFRTQFPGVPIVVLTGFPDVKLAIGLMKLGVKDYLQKPVEKKELLAVINKYVNEHVILTDQFAV